MTTTTPADERGAFEAWWADFNGTDQLDTPVLLKRRDDGVYSMTTTHYAWRAWQARAASQPAQEPVALFIEARDALHELGCHPDIPGWIADKCIDIAERMKDAPPADDEAVRLLREAREWLGNGLTVAKIDAYLAKAGK